MIVGHWATQRHYSVAQWLRRWTEWHVPVKRVWNPLWANGRYSASWNAAVYRLWKKKWCVYYLCSVMWNNVWKLNRTASTNKVATSCYRLRSVVATTLLVWDQLVITTSHLLQIEPKRDDDPNPAAERIVTIKGNPDGTWRVRTRV